MAGPAPDERMPPAYRFAKLFTAPVLKVFRVRSEGDARLRGDGPFVLASNHASWIDPVVLAALTHRTLHFLGHSGLFENPTVGRVLRDQGGVIGVDREGGGNEAALQAAIRALVGGGIVGIFPEGHRTRDGALLPFRSGVARLALGADVPVVPAAIASFDVWPRHAAVPDLSRPLGVVVGAPMRFAGLGGLGDDREVVRKVTRDVEDAVARLLEKAKHLREDTPR